jgi:tripartite-type tricarboxylate transporter receptor subunit TctC
MTKRFSGWAMVVLLSLTMIFITACGSDSSDSGESAEASADNYPDKPITLIVSFAAGGGTDVGARTLAPYVEDELGVSVTIENKPGGGGWVGWSELLNSEADGYTIAYINTPNLMTGYLNPELGRDNSLDDFALISNHVTDYGVIAVEAGDDRFETIDDLMEYAKENEVTTTSTGVGSDDHIAALKVNNQNDTQFTAVHGEGASEGKAGVLGGHIDAYFANVGEVKPAVDNGEMRALAVMAPERSEFLPDTPTLEESGYGEVFSWSARGLAAPEGVSEEKLEILREAFKNAIENAEQVEKMEDMGLAVNPLMGDDYKEFLQADEDGVHEVSDLLGW